MRCRLLPLAVLLIGCAHDADRATPPAGPALQVAAELPMHCNAAVTSPDGRLFVNFPHADGGVGVRVAEVRDGHTVVPYPDAGWNQFSPGKPRDAARQFVGTNSLRFGPDGLLWVVDTGVTAPDGVPVGGGAKLVAIDTATNAVAKTIDLGPMIRRDSFVDDLRFHGKLIYMTDAGHPAVIVFDTTIGQGRRVLEDDYSTTAHRPMRADGHVLHKFDGTDAKLNADQLEVSPDGRWFYMQPCPGPMVRIETRYLDDPALPAAELARHVEPFCDTPTSGGTAMAGDGSIYLNDAEDRSLRRITPDGHMATVLADPRLDWGDAMWIADDGDLVIPAAQQSHTTVFNAGVSSVSLPVRVYRLPLHLRPVRN